MWPIQFPDFFKDRKIKLPKVFLFKNQFIFFIIFKKIKKILKIFFYKLGFANVWSSW